MRTIIYLIFAIALAGCASAQPGEKSMYDIDAKNLKTEEGVLAELQKVADARLALRSPGGKKPRLLEARSVCIERLDKTAGIIVIGFFAYDRGCRLDGAFIGLQYVLQSDESFSRSALAELGWEKAPKATREDLVLYWTVKAIAAFSTVLYRKVDESGADFHIPRAVSNPDGSVTVELWTRDESDMRSGASVRRVKETFSREGTLMKP